MVTGAWLQEALFVSPPGPLAQRGLFAKEYFHSGQVLWDHLSFSIWTLFWLGFNSSCRMKADRSSVFLSKESLKCEWQWDLLSPMCSLTEANLFGYLYNKTEVFFSIHNTKRHSLKMNSSYPFSCCISICRCSFPFFYPAREEFSEPEMKKQPLRGLWYREVTTQTIIWVNLNGMWVWV